MARTREPVFNRKKMKWIRKVCKTIPSTLNRTNSYSICVNGKYKTEVEICDAVAIFIVIAKRNNSHPKGFIYSTVILVNTVMRVLHPTLYDS